MEFSIIFIIFLNEGFPKAPIPIFLNEFDKNFSWTFIYTNESKSKENILCLCLRRQGYTPGAAIDCGR